MNILLSIFLPSHMARFSYFFKGFSISFVKYKFLKIFLPHSSFCNLFIAIISSFSHRIKIAMQRIHCKFFCNMYISKGENKMDQKLKQDISIGTRIRELRIERHMTQEQVATKLQLSVFLYYCHNKGIEADKCHNKNPYQGYPLYVE